MKAYETVFRDRVAHYQNNTQEWDSSQDAQFVDRARGCQKLILEILNTETIRKTAIMHQSKMLAYILGGTVMAILGGFGYFLMAHLVRPVVVLTSMLREIASREGNLTLRLTVSQKDEIGDLAHYFNTFIEAIQLIIQEVSSRIKILATASEQLDHISAGLKNNAQETSEKSMAMTSTGTQMSANMNFITTASQETTASIEQMVLATGDMSTHISHIVQNTDKARSVSGRAVSKTKSASARIMELGNSAKNIGRVTETITEISEQTNLLALNANIEAARAGTAGRGFVVVANEIKALARQTAEATQDIEKDILGIQQTSLATSKEIGQISEIIREIDTIISSIAASVEEQSDTTQTFAQNLLGVSEKFHGVNENLSQGAQATKEMSRDISRIDRSAKEIFDNASLIRTSSEDLAGLSLELKDIIGRLRT
jgi:methyl-accepting chemotaxis protein